MSRRGPLYPALAFCLASGVAMAAYPPSAPIEAAAGQQPAPGNAVVAVCDTPDNPFANCSFESGDFTGWVTSDLAAPYIPLTVAGAGVTAPDFASFATAPTDGMFAAVHGFDGGGPGTIQIAQDIVLPPDAELIAFDYRGGWDLITFSQNATAGRTFRVEIQPSGGGAALQSFTTLNAALGTAVNDTGALRANLPVSAFAGQSVRVALIWVIPDNLSGPALFQVDNFALAQNPTAVPAGSPWSWLLLMGLAGIAGYAAMRARSHQA